VKRDCNGFVRIHNHKTGYLVNLSTFAPRPAEPPANAASAGNTIPPLFSFRPFAPFPFSLFSRLHPVSSLVAASGKPPPEMSSQTSPATQPPKTAKHAKVRQENAACAVHTAPKPSYPELT